MFPAPYTNTHELNLDWLLQTVKALQEKYGGLTTEIDEALAAIEAAKNDGLEAITAAIENGLEVVSAAIAADKASALNDIGAARSGALSDISGARSGALSDIDTAQTGAVSAIGSARSAALGDIDTSLTNALTSLQTSLSATLTILNTQEASIIGRVNTLLETLPADSAEILGLLNIIISILNADWAYTASWEQKYYDGDTGMEGYIDNTYLSSDTYGSQGCAGRRMKVTCDSNFYIYEIQYWKYTGGIYYRYVIPTPWAQEADVQFPGDADFFSITLRKLDHSVITASDIIGHVTVEWPMAAVEVPTMVAYLQSTLTAAKAYSYGDYFIYNGNLYKVLSNVAQYGTLDPTGNDPNCELIVGGLASEVSYLNRAVYGKQILNCDDVRPGYLSGSQGGAFTIATSSNTSVIVGIINVVKGMKYKIGITYGASIASAPQRYSNIVDANNIIVQRITIPAAVANSTAYVDFVAEDNGFLALALDNKWQQVNIYSDEVKTNIEELEKQTYTEQMKAAQINCYRSMAWTVNKGEALTTAFCKSVGAAGWIDVKPNTSLNNNGEEQAQQDGSRQASQFIDVGNNVAFDGFLLDDLPGKLKIAVRCYDSNKEFIDSATKPDGTTGPGISTLKRTFAQDAANNRSTRYIRLLFVPPDGAQVTDLAGVYTGRMLRMNLYSSTNEITSTKYALVEVEELP